MLKPIKNLLKDNLLIIAVVITLGILGLSLIKMPDTGIDIQNVDKVYHAFAYFTLTIIWLLTYYKQPNKKYIIFIACIIFGIIVEILQMSLTIYRTGDYLDVIANSSGALLALIIFNLFSKKKDIN